MVFCKIVILIGDIVGFTNANRKNAMKYIPSFWNKKDSPSQRKRQEIILNETLNLICNNILKNGITFDFMGETYKKDCFQKEDFKGFGDLAFLEERFRKIMDISALKEALKNSYPEENKHFVGPDYAERINGVPYVNDLLFAT